LFSTAGAVAAGGGTLASVAVAVAVAVALVVFVSVVAVDSLFAVLAGEHAATATASNA
jgi:hypothetical protein